MAKCVFRFIASQGPFARTVPHFWRMVFECQVKLIVMLTKLKENVRDRSTGQENLQVSLNKVNKTCFSGK